MLYQNIGENNVRHTPLYKGQINICKKVVCYDTILFHNFLKIKFQKNIYLGPADDFGSV